MPNQKQMLMRLPKCQAQSPNQLDKRGVHDTAQVINIQYQRIRPRAGMSRMK